MLPAKWIERKPKCNSSKVEFSLELLLVVTWHKWLMFNGHEQPLTSLAFEGRQDHISLQLSFEFSPHYSALSSLLGTPLRKPDNFYYTKAHLFSVAPQSKRKSNKVKLSATATNFDCNPLFRLDQTFASSRLFASH